MKSELSENGAILLVVYLAGVVRQQLRGSNGAFDTGSLELLSIVLDMSEAQLAEGNFLALGACLLTGVEYREEYDEAYIRDLLQRLVALGAKRAVLTGVSFEEGKLGVMSYDSVTGEYFTYFNEKMPASFHGTGDIFSSVVMGGLMRGLSMEDALKLAVDYTLECIRVTNKDETWYGVEFERVIPMLCERLKNAE